MAKQTSEAAPTGEPKLTDKEQRFIDIYCSGVFNKAKAARLAGYSAKWAKEIGQQNYAKLHIKEAIDKRLSELSLTDKETLKGISDIANSRLNDYFVVKQVYTKPQVKKHLSGLIAELEAQIEDANKLIARSKLASAERIEKHNEWVLQKEEEILELQIELERNPDAFRIVTGEPELKEVAELDLAQLIQDKEAGRIKSVKPTEFGLSVEMYAADAALTNLARIHGLFEKDNKQQQGKVTLKIGGKTIDRR